MATTRAIEAATVPTSFRVPGVNTFKAVPASLDSDIPMGVPLVLSSGQVAEAPIVDTDVYDGEGQIFYALSAEPFRKDYAAAGSVPYQQFDMGIVLLTPGVFIECNKYFDGDGDADDTLIASDVGDVGVLRKVNGKVVWDTTTATASHATFTVVKLVDQVGDVYGRVLVTPTASFKFAF